MVELSDHSKEIGVRQGATYARGMVELSRHGKEIGVRLEHREPYIGKGDGGVVKGDGGVIKGMVELSRHTFPQTMRET